MPLPIPRPTRRYDPPPPVDYDPDPYPRRVVEYVPRDEQPLRHPDPLDRAYRPPEDSPLQYQRERDRRTDRSNLIANTIRVVTALVALVFVLHIVFSVFGANENNGFVAFDYAVAKVFVLGFGDVFTPGDATIGLIANYGLAAIVYLVVGRLLYGTLRR
jgi:hypothetical protein